MSALSSFGHSDVPGCTLLPSAPHFVPPRHALYALFSDSHALHESAVACVTAVSFGQTLSPTFGHEKPAAPPPSSSSPQPALVARTREEMTNDASTVPGTVLALGLLLAWSQEVRVIVLERATFALALADTGWLLGLAYLVKFLALPVGQVSAGLRSVSPSLEEAARVAGAGWGRAMLRITGPLLLPNLASAWFLVFLPAFTEVTMSVLLSGPRTRVVGAVLFELQTYGDPPGAAALAVVVAAVVIAGQAFARRLAATPG